MRTSMAVLALSLGATFLLAPAVGSPYVRSDQAQDQEGAAPDTTEAEEGPTAMRASEIASRAEEANTRLREIRARLDEPDATVLAIIEQLPDFSESIRQIEQDPANRNLAQTSSRRLQNLRGEWQRLSAQMDDWGTTLAAQSQALESQRDTLAQIRAPWEATSEAAAELELPQAAIDQVEAFLAAIGEVRSLVRSELDSLVTLQTRIANESIKAREQIAQIENALGVARLRLLAQDSPPLWSALLERGPEISLTDGVREAWNEDTAALAQFLRDNRGRVIGQLALFIALLLLLLRLRQRGTEQIEGDESLQAYSQILAHPVSAALLITLVGSRLFYPQATEVVFDVIKLIGIVVVLRLLPGMLDQALRKPLYFLIGLYLFAQIDDLFLGHSVFERLYLLGLTALTLVALVWTVRPGDPASAMSGNRGWRAARLVARLGAVLMAASIVANLFGYVSLAAFLTSAMLNSAFIAAALYAAARVSTGLWTLVLRTGTAAKLNAVRKHRELLVRRGTSMINVGALLVWADITLLTFQVLGPLRNGLAAVLGFSFTVGAMTVSIGGILAFIVTIWITILLSRLVRFTLTEDVFPRLRLPRGVGDSISKVVHYTVLGFGIMVALAVAGIDLSNFALLAGALGIGIGFGLQNLVNNFVSGLILIFERPIQLGDTIEFGTWIGTVRRIGIRSSTVRTFDGAEVIVPNGSLISAEVVNWTLSDRLRRIEVSVGVAYGTDPQRVLDILLDVVAKHDNVLQHPEPLALFVGFGDSSLDFKTLFWTSNFDDWLRIRSDVTVKINQAVTEAGIEIPFPQRDLHLKSIDPSVKGELPLGESEKSF